ncbi:MAG: putative porin [Panacagrimonas sp.]
MNNVTPKAFSACLLTVLLSQTVSAQPAPLPAEPASPVKVVPLNRDDLQMTPGLGESLPPPEPAKSAPGEAADKTAPNGKVRVPYLTDAQRTQIKNELRDEILDTARKENWAQPETVPDWVRRLRIEGEMNVRVEYNNLDESNGNFVNYQEANRSGPLNTTPPPSGQPLTIPTLNSTEDRTIPRIRARIGLAYAPSDPLSVNLRLSTGNSINPVSNNQTIGNSFSKPAVVLDRAYIHYRPVAGLSLDLGRGPNIFSTGTDLIWDKDLSFDGIGIRYRHSFTDDRVLRFATGYYSVENTDPNFPSNSLVKNEGRNKWLWGTQLDYRTDLFTRQLFRAGVGLYTFDNIEGKRSRPCNAVSSSVDCDTDDSRPGFLQKGNTVFQIRDTQPINPGDPDFQFFGLASEFQVLSLAASWELPLTDTVRLAIDLDAARNLALDEGEIRSRPPDNNLGPCRTTSPTTVACEWDGGGDAWQAQMRVGRPVVRLPNDWQLVLGYRYIESDAVLDAFTDSDFHLGGTNAEGYYVGGSWGFSRAASLNTRYFGATEITSQQFGVDVWQLDVTVKF